MPSATTQSSAPRPSHAHYYFAAKRAEYRHAQRFYARRAYKYGY